MRKTTLLVCLVGLVAFLTGTHVAFAALPPCPTQQQLEARGVRAGQVTSPAQMSTGKLPLTATVVVPDEQCSYQGPLGLFLVYFHLTSSQAAAAQAHLSYECTRKDKKCTIFVLKGTSFASTVNAATGKSKTTETKTLSVLVTSGPVEGEATEREPTSTKQRCQALADTLFAILAGKAASEYSSYEDELDCPD